MSESATQRLIPAGIEIHCGYEPGIVGRVGELHGRYYAAAWGIGAGFELLMTREFCDFVEHYDSENDLLLSAHIDGVLAGSISILGNRVRGAAKLRFFLVDPRYHGRGAGKALLNAALSWCRATFSQDISLDCRSPAAMRGLYEPADSVSRCSVRTIATRPLWKTLRWSLHWTTSANQAGRSGRPRQSDDLKVIGKHIVVVARMDRTGTAFSPPPTEVTDARR